MEYTETILMSNIESVSFTYLNCQLTSYLSATENYCSLPHFEVVFFLNSIKFFFENGKDEEEEILENGKILHLINCRYYIFLWTKQGDFYFIFLFGDFLFSFEHFLTRLLYFFFTEQTFFLLLDLLIQHLRHLFTSISNEHVSPSSSISSIIFNHEYYIFEVINVSLPK